MNIQSSKRNHNTQVPVLQLLMKKDLYWASKTSITMLTVNFVLSKKNLDRFK